MLDDLRKAIIKAVEDRERFIAENNLDEKFCLPDGHWRKGTQDYTSLYEQLRDCSDVQDLRLWSRNFSGCANLNEEGWVARWEKITAGVPDQFLFKPLELSHEPGPLIRGIPVNHDTYVYQERIELMRAGEILNRLDKLNSPLILEIGGGYGALALAIRRIVPHARYIICDLPECLLFSGMYLGLTGESVQLMNSPLKVDKGVTLLPKYTLVPNYLFHELTEPIDLAINTLSMSEMSEHQVSVYAEGISSLIGMTGLFFEQNINNHCPGWIDAKKQIEPHFAVRHTIQLPNWVTQGQLDIWYN